MLRLLLLATILACGAQAPARADDVPLGANGKPCLGAVVRPPFPFKLSSEFIKAEQRQKKLLARAGFDKAGRYDPLAYRDPKTNILFYVETDGQHLSAIGPDGKLIWTKAWNMCSYRVMVPRIAHVGYVRQPKAGDYIAEIHRKWPWLTTSPVIAVVFDSSQFGLVNQKTGDFFFSGQD